MVISIEIKARSWLIYQLLGMLMMVADLVAAETLNLLVIGQLSTPQPTGLQWFTDQKGTMNAIPPLAIQHFNARDGRIVPEFGSRTCNLTINLVRLADDQGSPAPAMRALVTTQNAAEIDVIVGPVRSAVAQPIAVTASALQIPIVSHWATSPNLGDKKTYEYFSRTCPQDGARATLITDLLVRLGFSKIGMLFMNDDFGIGWRNAMLSECEKRGINLTTISYDDATGRILERGINSAMQQLASAKLNVVFFVIGLLPENLLYIAQAATNYGMVSKDNFYVHTINDYYFAERVFPESKEMLREFMRGSITILDSVPGLGNDAPNPQLNALRTLWPTFKESDVNPFFPPPLSYVSGGAPFRFPAGKFANTTGDIFNAFTWYYDAVATVGLAACQLLDEGRELRNGSNLLKAIRNQNFDGVSGRVRFVKDTGDRDPFSSVYLVNNIVRLSDGSLTSRSLGMYLPSSSGWRLDMSAAEFRDGSSQIPSDVQIPPHDENLLPLWAKVIGYIETSLGLAFGLFCFAWMYRRRKETVVIQSQPVFMSLIALGLCLVSAAIVPLTIEGSDSACMAFPFLFTIGIALAVSSIGVKSLRVGRLWFRISARKKDKGVDYLLLVAASMVIQLIVLIVWSQVAPLVWRRVVTMVDVNGNPMTSFGLCDASHVPQTFVFLGLQVALLSVLVIITGLLSVWVHNAPEKFQDAKMTAIAAVSLVQVYLLGVPIVVLTYTTPLPRFLVLSTLCFLTSLVLFLFLFVPKFIRANQDRKSSRDQASGNGSGDKIKGSPEPIGQNKVGNPQMGGSPSSRKVFLRFSPIPLISKRGSTLRKQAKSPKQDEDAAEKDVRSRAKAHRSDFAAAVVHDTAAPNANKVKSTHDIEIVDDEKRGTPDSRAIHGISPHNWKASSGESYQAYSTLNSRELAMLSNDSEAADISTSYALDSYDLQLKDMLDQERIRKGTEGRAQPPVQEERNPSTRLGAHDDSSYYNSSALNLLLAFEQQQRMKDLERENARVAQQPPAGVLSQDDQSQDAQTVEANRKQAMDIQIV